MIFSEKRVSTPDQVRGKLFGIMLWSASPMRSGSLRWRMSFSERRYPIFRSVRQPGAPRTP
jgi:hypothetical protein